MDVGLARNIKMGSFQIWDISFKSNEGKDKFEKLFNEQYGDELKIMVGEESNSGGFIAWRLTRDASLDIVYNAGYCGYAELSYFLDLCKKEDFHKEIKFASFLSINDRMTEWEKVKGKHYA